MRRSSRGIALLLGVAAVAVAGAFFIATRSPSALVFAEPTAPVLPDLVSVPLTDFLIGTDEVTGEEALRFSATVANAGAGELRLEALRSGGSASDWQVSQVFAEPDGSRSGVLTDATLVFGGHGHDHWHLASGVSYRLFADGSNTEAASQRKAGFCFFDQVRIQTADDATSPQVAAFQPAGCGVPDSRSVTMGMSPGWSDPYFWQLLDQSVIVSGLEDGRYRLTALADPDGWLTESDEDNNETWVVLNFGTQADGLRTVVVVDQAPD